jgi:N-acetylneuraminic acid mutarotase
MKKYLFLLVALLSLSISLNAQTCATAVNQWQTLGDASNLTRYNAFNFVIGNKAYVGGGSYTVNNTVNLRNDYRVYDAASNTWAAVANLPATGITGSYDGVGFSVGRKGYLLYGKTVSAGASVYAGKFYEFDPTTNAWTDRSSSLTGKDQLLYSANMVAMSINGRVFIGGGELWNYS